jgi:hypothetical protein
MDDMDDTRAERRDRKRRRRMRGEAKHLPELPELPDREYYRRKYHKPQRGGVREFRVDELSQDDDSRAGLTP